MTENHDMSSVAEAKELPSHQVRALTKEITDFAGSQASLLETIEQKDLEINQLKKDLRMLAKNYIRIDYERLDSQGLNSYAERIRANDPFFREDNSLIDELKRNYPFIFEDGGRAPGRYGTNEWERGTPDLMFYGDVANPKDDNADY